LYLAGKSRVLGRLLDALARAVEFPAVIEAADIVALDPAEVHQRAAVRAAVIKNLGAPRVAPIQGEVLSHDADRLRVPARQVFAAVHRDPELAHEFAARRAGQRGSNVDGEVRNRSHSGCSLIPV